MQLCTVQNDHRSAQPALNSRLADALDPAQEALLLQPAADLAGTVSLPLDDEIIFPPFPQGSPSHPEFSGFFSDSDETLYGCGKDVVVGEPGPWQQGYDGRNGILHGAGMELGFLDCDEAPKVPLCVCVNDQTAGELGPGQQECDGQTGILHEEKMENLCSTCMDLKNSTDTSRVAPNPAFLENPDQGGGGGGENYRTADKVCFAFHP
jgi:hypothetical protein